jgi:acyl carrier protein
MKPLDEFVALFAEQFDDTDANEITASTFFHDLDEWSSLIGLSVIAMVDEEYDVEFRGDDIRGSQTVEDLYKRVKARIE